MTNEKKTKRVTVNFEYPTNIFFVRVLKKLYDDADAAGKGSKFTYHKAFKSLKSYPLEIQNSWDAKTKLNGFGDGICSILDRSLEQFKAKHGDLTLETVKRLSNEDLSVLGRKNAGGGASHRPAPLKLQRTSSAVSFDEGNVQVLSSAKTGLESRTQSFPAPKKARLAQIDVPQASIAVAVPSFSGNVIRLNPGDFEIKLIVDYCESGVADMEKAGLDLERHRLSAGDFAWIARQKVFVEQELMLDYIMERKRLDDLAQSICENRYRDQKVRLRECGITNRIYLVEWSERKISVPIETLKQAMLNTQVQEDFYLKVTEDAKDTALYLKALTAKIWEKYRNKRLSSRNPNNDCNDEKIEYLMTFGAFQDVAAKVKPLSVRELFARQLMVVRGMTMEKSNAIVAKYPTFCSLLNAYENIGDSKTRHGILANLEYGSLNRKIGPALSSTVASFFEAMIE